MRLTLLIGPNEEATARFRALAKQNEKNLTKHGIAAPQWNHVRLYAAVAQADEVGVLRHRRGMDNPLFQQALTNEFNDLLTGELKNGKANHILLCAAQLGNLLSHPEEFARLRALLDPHFSRIEIVVHIEEQAKALCRHYGYAVMEGRTASLAQELDLAGEGEWWTGALALREKNDAFFGQFNDIQKPPFWLDYAALLEHWQTAFGKDHVALRPLDLTHLMSERGSDELARTLGLENGLGKAAPARLAMAEPAANLTRMRLLNEILIKYLRKRDILLPRTMWAQFHNVLRIPGPPLSPGNLFAISDRFSAANATLIRAFPDLASALTPVPKQSAWTEADPQFGFRASQYLAAFGFTIRKHSTPLSEKRAELALAQSASVKFETMFPKSHEVNDDQGAQERLLNRIKINHQMVLNSQFRPHNNLSTVDEESASAPYASVSAPAQNSGRGDNVIVACMKNEAPYIVEWIAYHRAIGVDTFLIYTNDCDDPTNDILGRLQQMGIVEHRRNEKWKGKSPQQHALNQSLKEPTIQNAKWIIHIDVDEYMNIRTGNGTLQDLFDAVPDATNFAMTWRLFGHNDVTTFVDKFVIGQFDACAPQFCPKPHTSWGYKTMFRNIGAYEKISCHRPNKLSEDAEDKIKWVNGSGNDMTRDAAKNGWRSSRTNIGYDLLQLNHYALRSAESFLIKRQRGRALHVDRSIGINYWIRMDWSDFRDHSIKRNIPRLRGEYEALMQDDELKKYHQEGVAWHKAKAAELRKIPEFSALYEKALNIKLSETERVAYALSLDTES